MYYGVGFFEPLTLSAQHNNNIIAEKLTLHQMIVSYAKNSKETPVQMMAESPVRWWGIVDDIMVDICCELGWV